ncbi:hypothetical protein ACIOHE_15510 [Streptomyces sp. NPDC087851]|uniref:hypothetical protein n=1 Tax=Streptomyces sp. NPDC087851 TaxID=3365810 RepID=UPI00381959F7
MKDSRAWVGDEIHDERTGRTGIVTDVRSGTYVLRPIHGGGEWTTENAGDLTVVVPLPEPSRRRMRRPHGRGIRR